MAYSNYIHRTPSGAGNRKKFTISTWVKRPVHNGQGWIMTVDSYPSGNMFQYQLDTGSYLNLGQYSGSSAQVAVSTSNLLRDPAAWYHLVLRVDTTQSTAADRVRMYINGTEASYSTTTYPSQNYDFAANNTVKHSIGSREDTSSGTSLYYSHYHFCDGYSYGPDSFGSTDATTGEWKINTSPSVSYGTNGFFIFKNGMNLSGSTVQDQSGQSNNLTLVGSSVETQDNPSNSFPLLNQLNPQSSGYTFDGLGSLSVTGNTGDAWRTMYATFGARTGKYYWEQKITNFTGVDPHYIGIVSDDQMSNANIDQATTSRGYFYTKTGAKRNNNSQTSYGDSWTTNDIVGIALDLDNSKLYFSKNGTWQDSGDPTSGSTGTGAAFTITSGYTYIPATSTYYNLNRYAMNFGNGYFGNSAVSSAGTNASNIGIFEYDVPTGYTALSTKGLNE